MTDALPHSGVERDVLELRTCRSSCITICILPGLLVLFYLYLALRTAAAATGLVITLALLSLAVYLAASFRVRLSPSGIHYRGPFFTRGALSWPAIARVTTRARLIPGLRTPPYYMALVPRDRSRPLVINIKPFGRDDLARLVAFIKAHAPSATLDAATEGIGRRRLPSLVRSKSHDAV